MILSIFDNYISLQLNPSVLILFVSNLIAVSDSGLIRCCMILYFTSIQQWHIQDQFDFLMTLGNTLVIMEAVVFVMYVVSGYFIYDLFSCIICLEWWFSTCFSVDRNLIPVIDYVLSPSIIRAIVWYVSKY